MAVINIPGILPSSGDLNQTAPIGVGQLGLPVYDDVTFPSGNYEDLQGNIIEYAGLSLQNGRITITQRSNRIKTPVAGKNGTIKELISLGDYEVRIETKLTELANVFPYDQAINWKNIKNSTESIPVISKWLNDVYEVENLVIDDFQFNTIAGSINEVDLIITASSDDGFNIKDFDITNTNGGTPVNDIFTIV